MEPLPWLQLVDINVNRMFRGLKKKIESDQKAKIVFSPSRVEAKPGGPVRLSSTSEREDENEVEQTSLGISIHSNEDDSHRNFVRNDLLCYIIIRCP